jgi:hypothetical protein
MQEGVDVELSKSQKDELVLTGNSLEHVSQSAADIQQICKVRNKDIRKVCFLPPLWSSLPMDREGFLFCFSLTIRCSSWTVCTFPKRATLLKSKRGRFTDTEFLFLLRFWV